MTKAEKTLSKAFETYAPLVLFPEGVKASNGANRIACTLSEAFVTEKGIVFFEIGWNSSMGEMPSHEIVGKIDGPFRTPHEEDEFNTEFYKNFSPYGYSRYWTIEKTNSDGGTIAHIFEIRSPGMFFKNGEGTNYEYLATLCEQNKKHEESERQDGKTHREAAKEQITLTTFGRNPSDSSLQSERKNHQYREYDKPLTIMGAEKPPKSKRRRSIRELNSRR